MKADKCNHMIARIFEKTRIMHGSGPFIVETWDNQEEKSM
jgi:hypothetical protein